MKKVQLDLETLGTEPGCIVLSIGAVMFNHEDGEQRYVGGEDERFHIRLETVTQYAVGLTADPGTVLFWMEQPKEAQEALLSMPAVDVRQGLAMFADWLEEHVGATEIDDEGNPKPLEVEVWGRGANFDGPILREVYKAVALRCPWAFWNERCQRTEHKTLQRYARHFAGRRIEDPVREGVHHDALDDAVYQAEVLCHYAEVITNNSATR